ARRPRSRVHRERECRSSYREFSASLPGWGRRAFHPDGKSYRCDIPTKSLYLGKRPPKRQGHQEAVRSPVLPDWKASPLASGAVAARSPDGSYLHPFEPECCPFIIYQWFVNL